MVDSIKIRILEELNKPLPANGIYTSSTIRERMGVPKEHTTDEWLTFYNEFAYCIDGGLVVFLTDWDKKEFERESKNYRGVNCYLNYLMDKGVRITPTGEAWLAHMKSAKRIEDGGHTQIASGNKFLSDNTFIKFDFSNLKLNFKILGRDGSVDNKELGIIVMVIEIVISGILMSQPFWDKNYMTYTWITAGVLIITAVIFFGAKEFLKN